jgi:hypothetical protein
MTSFENRPSWQKPEHDTLVTRLQDLEWTEVRPELRQRCWEDFMGKLASGPKPVDGPARTGERYAFSRVEGRPGSRPVADARAAAARITPLQRASGRL